MLHRNLPLKAASLILAIFLWFWVLVNERVVVTSRTVPVVVQTSSSLPVGLRITSLQVSPPVVTVSGAVDQVDDIRSVATAELQLDGLTEDTTKRLALLPPDGAKLVKDTSVRVTVRVASELPLAKP